MPIKHASLTANHRPYAAVYADAAARTAATGFPRGDAGAIVPFHSIDLYKVALQSDDNSVWMLSAVTPTWVQVGGAPVTTEQIQDVVGAMFPDVATIDWTYDDATGVVNGVVIGAAPTGSAGGDLSGTFPNPTVANDAITNAKLANMAQATIKGRASGAGTGDPTDLTATQATAILDAMVGDSGSGGTKGLAPAPAAGDAAAAKFLKADGSWAAVSSGMTNPMTTAGDIIYGGASGAPTRLAAGTNGFILTLSGGNPVWAVNAGAAGAIVWTEVVKAVDQTVTASAVPIDDTELFFSMDASGVYSIEFEILYSGNNATGDYRWRFAFSALANAIDSNGWMCDLTGADSSQLTNRIGTTTQWPSADFIPGTDAADGIRMFHGKLMIRNSTGSANTFKMQFANAAASSGRTSTTRAGSRIRYRKLN